jgi:hypothetical protein
VSPENHDFGSLKRRSPAAGRQIAELRDRSAWAAPQADLDSPQKSNQSQYPNSLKHGDLAQGRGPSDFQI